MNTVLCTSYPGNWTRREVPSELRAMLINVKIFPLPGRQRRVGLNGNRIKNASRLGSILRRLVKEATNGDSISLRSRINNKDSSNFGMSKGKRLKYFAEVMSVLPAQLMRQTTDLSSLKISRNMGSNDNSDAIPKRDLSSLRNSKKETAAQGRTKSETVHPIERHIPPITYLKRKSSEMCNMLKKKHKEAKELLVRAIVNNNHLLMLNHPTFDAKIHRVKKFDSQLVSKGS